MFPSARRRLHSCSMSAECSVVRADLKRAVDRALAVPVLATVPAAMTGAADWRDLQGETRQLLGHRARACQQRGTRLERQSLMLRAQGKRGSGRLALFSALLATTLAAHIGGELSFGLGTRVNRTAWPTPPDKFTAVAPAKTWPTRASAESSLAMLRSAHPLERGCGVRDRGHVQPSRICSTRASATATRSSVPGMPRASTCERAR